MRHELTLPYPAQPVVHFFEKGSGRVGGAVLVGEGGSGEVGVQGREWLEEMMVTHQSTCTWEQRLLGLESCTYESRG